MIEMDKFLFGAAWIDDGKKGSDTTPRREKFMLQHYPGSLDTIVCATTRLHLGTDWFVDWFYQ